MATTTAGPPGTEASAPEPRPETRTAAPENARPSSSAVRAAPTTETRSFVRGWRRTPADVPPLAALQRELLDSALRSVRVGGVVAYVTCSPHTAETVDVVDAAVQRGDMAVLPVAPLFPEVPTMARGEYAQLWPHRHGTDAMFIALLRRLA